MTLHVIQATVSLPAVIRHLRQTANMRALRGADDGILIKTAFVETMGSNPDRQGPPPWPKPFAVISRRSDGTIQVAGYASRSAEEIRALMIGVPSIMAAVPPDQILGYALPAIAVGWRSRFSIQFCPMVRVADNRERDVFLVEVEQATKAGREVARREEVYADFLGRRLSGAAVDDLFVEGFSLDTVARGKDDACWGDPSARHTIRVPSVTIHGTLTVTDPDSFTAILGHGIGRRRTYGNGMIRLGAMAQRQPMPAA